MARRPMEFGLLSRHSMSVRLLVLVVGAVLLGEALIFIPGLQRERARWLQERLRDAQIVALASGVADGSALTGDMRASMQRMFDAQMISKLLAPGAHPALQPAQPFARGSVVDLDTERWLQGFQRALGDIVFPGDRRLEVLGTSAIGTRLQLVVAQAPLAQFLRHYTFKFATVAILIALLTGVLLFIALRAMLVVPLRRMARNIAAFRTDPERGVPLDAERVSVVGDDEITLVGRELSAMQAELRAALWRNARLAAVGTAVAKMSHDLRGILSSALLVADRLTMNREDKVREAGEVIVRAVHRATLLAQSTLDFVREGPPALARSRLSLHALVDEAAAGAAEPGRHCTIRNNIAAELTANVERDSLLRVLTNLFRNAAQAGASAVVVDGAGDDPATVLTIADDGPGLPEPVREKLFRPFVASSSGGSGLGLAIARDLMRAHGGDLQLGATGPQGTRFKLYLQQPKPEED